MSEENNNKKRRFLDDMQSPDMFQISQISDILNEFSASFSRKQNNETSNTNDTLIHISNILTNMANNLNEKLNKIISLLDKNNNEKMDFIIENREIPNITLKLANFRHERNNSYYKYLSNKGKSDLYETHLKLENIEIPKKLHEKISSHDHIELIDVKKSMTISKVEAEIKKLRIHQNIHLDKIRKIDENANSMIASVHDETRRTKINNDWNNFIKQDCAYYDKKWENSKAFLNNGNHFVLLGTIYQPKKTNYNQKNNKFNNFSTSNNQFFKQNVSTKYNANIPVKRSFELTNHNNINDCKTNFNNFHHKNNINNNQRRYNAGYKNNHTNTILRNDFENKINNVDLDTNYPFYQNNNFNNNNSTHRNHQPENFRRIFPHNKWK
jgi:hypothetical protein